MKIFPNDDPACIPWTLFKDELLCIDTPELPDDLKKVEIMSADS